jgi:peptidoglycan/xylan/chitin deacetylase (PgdA/CDA1 family)
MMNVFIQNKQYSDQIKYVFNTISFILGIKIIYRDSLDELSGTKDELSIVYGSSAFEIQEASCNLNHYILIKESGKLFGTDYLKTGSIPSKVCKYKPSGSEDRITDIISIYNDGELYIKRGEGKNTIKTNIDIISDVFFMLTRYEEVVNKEFVEKDQHDRFPARESLAYKNDFLHRPVVNEHVELLWSWIDSFSLGYRKRNWWGQKAFGVCLSHDVDHILKNGNLVAACRHTLAIIFRFHNCKKAFHYIKNYFQNRRDYTKDPYWTFNYIVRLEKEYNLNSSFYFMASAASDPDIRYDIHDRRVRELISELEAHGCEVGYHGSLRSYNNKKIMDAEKKSLDGIVSNKPYGCRQHYMKYQIPFTWRYQQQSGILYDTTLSYAEHEGFRCGMCFPYKPYDIIEDKVLDIWEIPLIIMEGTLQSTMYRNLPPEEGLKRIKNMIETAKRHQGVFSILWHNSSFDYNWEGWGYVFEETMKYLVKSNCLSLSGRECIEHITCIQGNSLF